MIRYGRYYTTAEADFGTISANASRSCVFDAATANVWVTKWGGVFGRYGASTPSVRLSAYTTDSSKNPVTRIGYSAVVSPATQMAAAGGGAHYTGNISGSDNGPTNDACLLYSGERYAIDILSTNYQLGHSMIASGSITADNEQFYNRTAPGTPPPSAYGAYSASVEGHLTVYMEGYENEAPSACTSLVPSGTITDTAPTFTAVFNDLNGTYGTSSGLGVDTGDRVYQYTIQVRRVSDAVSFWNQTYTAGSTERSSDNISRAYGGTALVRGTAYEWRIRCSDEFATWGSWTSWTSFTPASLGYVTLDGNPTGTVQDNSPDFEGRWNHQSATGMTQAKVRVLSSTGTVLQTSAAFAKVAASSALPGTLFTCTWANTGFTDLAWGTSYRYQIQGYDGTNWSDWSTYRTFSTNAAPSIPVLSSPATGSVLSAYPLLTFTMSDADDTTATGLTGVIRITQPALTTVDVTPTYNVSSLKWEYQTTIVQISAVGAYSWKATGYDGTLYSGEASALGSATFSSSNTFTYATGPTVTVSSPADLATVATASLTVSWSVSGGTQAKYQVVVYADGTSTVVYDSGLITSTAVSHVIPSGYLRNGTSYDIIVAITDTTPLVGYSSVVNITVTYTAPTAVANFQATAIPVGLDPFETAIRLSWDQTAYSTPEFVEYTITRSADAGPDADEIILARITSPATVAFIDYTPASGYDYTYGITVSTLTGVDTLDSDPVYASTSVTLEGTVLTLVGNPGTYRSCLLNVRERGHNRNINEAVYQSLSGTKPTTVRSRARFWSSDFEGAIIPADDATALQRRNELDDLDAQNGTVCYRDGRGIKRFCKIVDFNMDDEKPDWYSYTFGLREEDMTEGTT